MEKPATSSLDKLDSFETCRFSILHLVFAPSPGSDLTFWKHRFLPYVVTALLFFIIPLLIAAVSLSAFAHPTSAVKVPYLRDWNTLFMFAVTLPVLVVLLLSDRVFLPSRIAHVCRDGVLTVAPYELESFLARWERTHGIVNIAAYVLGILVGAAVGWQNYTTNVNSDLGAWPALGNQMTLAGWVFVLWQLPLFYLVVTVYLIRAVATVIFLKQIVQLQSDSLRTDPFSPDNSGGLSPIGRIGLRNQYVLAVGGINVLLLIKVAQELEPSANLTGLIIAACILYIVGGPFVFLGPLLPFRRYMLESKNRELRRVANRLREEYDRLMGIIDNRVMSEDEMHSIKRLEEFKRIVAKIPVWPFDANTCKKFLGAYIIPILMVIATAFAGQIADVLNAWLWG